MKVWERVRGRLDEVRMFAEKLRNSYDLYVFLHGRALWPCNWYHTTMGRTSHERALPPRPGFPELLHGLGSILHGLVMAV
ncbi:unnamed protein product [Linum trigynum]|uniref:Uncharacterized protein n=1 Tax=Linum trigynum TaxID=586398 RepID=A0AAV2CL07_9ROSI